METLPREIIQQHILDSNMSVKDILSVCSTNAYFRNKICTDTFWKQIFFRTFSTRDQKLVEQDQISTWKEKTVGLIKMLELVNTLKETFDEFFFQIAYEFNQHDILHKFIILAVIPYQDLDKYPSLE